MSISDFSFQAAVDKIEQLSVAHSEFPVNERGGAVDSESYERMVDRFDSDDPIGDVGVWVTNDDGAVLLVRRQGEEEWSDPSGTRERGESYTDAARRVVREETGVDCAVTGVHHADVTEIRDADDEDRPPIVRLDVVFEADHEGGDPTPAGEGIEAARWWETMPESLLYPELSELPLSDL